MTRKCLIVGVQQVELVLPVRRGGDVPVVVDGGGECVRRCLNAQRKLAEKEVSGV